MHGDRDEQMAEHLGGAPGLDAARQGDDALMNTTTIDIDAFDINSSAQPESSTMVNELSNNAKHGNSHDIFIEQQQLHQELVVSCYSQVPFFDNSDSKMTSSMEHE